MIRSARFSFAHRSGLPVNHRVVEQVELVLKVPFPVRAVGRRSSDRDVEFFHKLLDAWREKFSSVCEDGMGEIGARPLFRPDRL